MTEPWVIKRGFDDTELARQRYECHDCDKRFDDLTGAFPYFRSTYRRRDLLALTTKQG